jgi:hypothetical protein
LKLVLAVAAAEVIRLALEFGPVFDLFVYVHTAHWIDRHIRALLELVSIKFTVQSGRLDAECGYVVDAAG